MHSVVRHGEAASSDKAAADKFKVEFEQYVNAEQYVLQQVFNMDETGLFWKKMPRRMYISREKSMPGHRPMKDKPTLLLCGNATGDFKVKPLLIYHSENPRAFKANNVIKGEIACYVEVKHKGLADQANLYWVGAWGVWSSRTKIFGGKEVSPCKYHTLLQSMDQQVIANFKKLYTKFLFQRCFEVTSDTQRQSLEPSVIQEYELGMEKIVA